AETKKYSAQTAGPSTVRRRVAVPCPNTRRILRLISLYGLQSGAKPSPRTGNPDAWPGARSRGHGSINPSGPPIRSMRVAVLGYRFRHRTGGTERLALRLGQGSLPAAPLGVVGKTRAGRDQAPYYNVFLQTPQGVPGTSVGCLGQHARGLLEGGCGDERFGRKRRLGDAEQHRQHPRGALVARFGPRVFLHQAHTVDLLAPQEPGITRFADLDLAQHLTNDRLDVLVVDL